MVAPNNFSRAIVLACILLHVLHNEQTFVMTWGYVGSQSQTCQMSKMPEWRLQYAKHEWFWSLLSARINRTRRIRTLSSSERCSTCLSGSFHPFLRTLPIKTSKTNRRWRFCFIKYKWQILLCLKYHQYNDLCLIENHIYLFFEGVIHLQINIQNFTNRKPGTGLKNKQHPCVYLALKKCVGKVGEDSFVVWKDYSVLFLLIARNYVNDL